MKKIWKRQKELQKDCCKEKLEYYQKEEFGDSWEEEKGIYYLQEEQDRKRIERGKKRGLLQGVRSLSLIQFVMAAAVVALFLTAIGTGVVYYNYTQDQKRTARLQEIEAARAAKLSSPMNTVNYQVLPLKEEIIVEENPEIEEEQEMDEIEETIEEKTYLGLELTSLDKDLKIKIVDQNGRLVKDFPWRVLVNHSTNGEKEYTDEDKDAVIYIQKLEPGSYTVALVKEEGQEDYVWPKSHVQVAVKGQLEYKAIAEIKSEIKKETEVNVAVEDTEHNNVIEETGPVQKDTVEWLESTKTEIASEAVVEYIEYTGKVNVPKEVASSRKGRMQILGAAGMPFLGDLLATADTGQGGENQTVSENNTTNTELPQKQTFTVVFKDFDGREIHKETVEEGQGANAPNHPSREGYIFEKWDQDFSNVTKDLTVTAIYREASIQRDGKLTDEKGNVLYKKVGEEYVEATGEDWANDLRAYYSKVESTKSTYKYTGWQTIEGKTYYFLSDGTPVTGDQIIGGVTYHFGSDGSLNQSSGTFGIDVSKWNGSIDWRAVRASGVSYVIIRCGYRGSSTGALIEDPTFKKNISGAKAAGLKVGVYFFTQAVTEAEAVEEASMCIALCKGYGLDYPIFMDVESGPRADFLDAGTRTNIIRAFCETIRGGGYTPGVYANKTWLTSHMNASALGSYKIWLAQYNTSGPTYKGRYDLWQYTSKGTIQGIKGYVDCNQSYLGY